MAGAGLAGAGLFAFKNVAEGNGNVKVNPSLGLNFNPQTGQFAPTLGANLQVRSREREIGRLICLLQSS